MFYGDKANRNFDTIQNFRQTNDWILNGIRKDFTTSRVIDRIKYAQGWVAKEQEATELLKHYTSLDETGLYNPRKLPLRYLAQIQERHTSVGWAAMDHSADYVELAMFGPGSELLKPFVKNTELHNFMLTVTGKTG